MTNKQSTARMILYILIAMTATASGGIQSVNFTDTKQVMGYVLAIITTGLITARSYIDQSPNQVDRKDP